MNSLQKTGGVAALVMAATFVVGFAVFLTLLVPAGYLAVDVDPVQKAALLADNQVIVSLSYVIAYVVFGAFLVVLALALYERLKAGSPALAQTAAAFGLIWAGLVIASGMVANVGIAAVVDRYGQDPAQAASLWLTLDLVVNGLGGGNEIVGGLWLLLTSWAALQAGRLPRALSYLGLGIGAVGVLHTFQTVVPALEVLGAAFGLVLIVWFVWVGVFLLRDRQV